MGAARQPSEDHDVRLAGLPCSVCGRPSAGWVYASKTDAEGRDVISAYTACAAHRIEPLQPADSQAS